MTEISARESIGYESKIMKTCIPSDGKNLLDPIASSFERCLFFIIIESNLHKVIEPFLNDVQTAARGVAIQIAQLIIEKQVKTVITPDIDSKALKLLLKAGIKIYLGVDGTIQDNIDLLYQDRLVELHITE